MGGFGYSDAALELMLDTLGAYASSVSLHDGPPGSTGAHELTGGAPLYCRRDVAWQPASGERKLSAAPLSFEVPGGVTVRAFGLWSRDGLWLGSAPLPPDYFERAGVYRLDLARLILNRKA